MKKIIILIIIGLLGFNLYAQKNHLNDVLSEVEKNNTTLSAYRKSLDAEKIGNKTGLNPQNPEAEFNYLWGSPSSIGNRTDFSVKQMFDFPTAYSHKSRISYLKTEQAELEYKRQRNEILYQTRVICVNLIYQNALKVGYNKRYSNALQIANAYKNKYNTGDIGVLEYNKAQMNLLNIQKELENSEIDQNTWLSELTKLNGGIFINFSDSIFSMQTIADDFGQWYAQAELNNPILQWIKQEIAISEKQIQLNTALSLPKFYAGYMSEKVTQQQFQGITAGVVIPLWENKNETKYAKARSVAIKSTEIDAKLQFFHDMKILHAKATALQNSVSDYHKKLSEYSNDKLLIKAFEKGEISLTEYQYELSLYYEGLYKLLEMEKNLHLAYEELNKYL